MRNLYEEEMNLVSGGEDLYCVCGYRHGDWIAHMDINGTDADDIVARCIVANKCDITSIDVVVEAHPLDMICQFTRDSIYGMPKECEDIKSEERKNSDL